MSMINEQSSGHQNTKKKTDNFPTLNIFFGMSCHFFTDIKFDSHDDDCGGDHLSFCLISSLTFAGWWGWRGWVGANWK